MCNPTPAMGTVSKTQLTASALTVVIVLSVIAPSDGNDLRAAYMFFARPGKAATARCARWPRFRIAPKQPATSRAVLAEQADLEAEELLQRGEDSVRVVLVQRMDGPGDLHESPVRKLLGHAFGHVAVQDAALGAPQHECGRRHRS